MSGQQPEGRVQRLQRIEHEIVRELSEIVHEQLKDPRVGFVTFTRGARQP